MMKAAFVHWDHQITPVFDVAHQIRVVEAESGRIIRKIEGTLANDLPVPKALRLAELGINTLIGGAISRPLHEMLAAYGIQVIPFVAGELDKLVQVWLKGDLKGKFFAMLGGPGQGHRQRRGRVPGADLGAGWGKA